MLTVNRLGLLESAHTEPLRARTCRFRIFADTWQLNKWIIIREERFWA